MLNGIMDSYGSFNKENTHFMLVNDAQMYIKTKYYLMENKSMS